MRDGRGRDRAFACVVCRVSVTGVAGPAGGSVDKPVGTVWIAVAKAGSPARAERRLFDGDRTKIREATVVAALQCVIAQVLEG